MWITFVKFHSIIGTSSHGYQSLLVRFHSVASHLDGLSSFVFILSVVQVPISLTLYRWTRYPFTLRVLFCAK